MLKYLKVRNYLSICEEVELNLEASQYGTKKSNFFSIGKTTLSKSKLLYWANASWKTTLIRALLVVRHTALNSAIQNISIAPFLLNEESNREPSFFEVWFFVLDKEYVYNFSLFGNKVITENLIEVRVDSQKILFSRENGQISCDPSFQSEVDKWLEKMKEGASFLSVLNNWNGQLHGKPIWYFFSKINIVLSGSWEVKNDWTLNFLKPGENNHNNNKALLIDFLRCADLRVDDIKVTEIQPSEEMLAFIKENPSSEAHFRRTRVEIGHKKKSGDMQYFDLQAESSGTRKLFSLMGFIVKTIQNEEILFVDEIETNLHPHILEALINLIHSDLWQKYQFVFATHNTEILNLELMKKEQILFLNRNSSFSTQISSLSDYPDVRSENDIKKKYDMWAFWGIPKPSHDFATVMKHFISAE